MFQIYQELKINYYEIKLRKYVTLDSVKKITSCLS